MGFLAALSNDSSTVHMEKHPMVSNNVSKQYYFDGKCTNLFRRIAKSMSMKEKERLKWEKLFYHQLSELQFIPSPNLLSAGVTPLRPSGCVLSKLNDENFPEISSTCDRLWQNGISVGIDFSQCTDPSIPFRALATRHFEIVSNTKQSTWNTVMLSIKHEKLLQFLQTKTDLGVQGLQFQLYIVLSADATYAEHEKELSVIASLMWENQNISLLTTNDTPEAGSSQQPNLGPRIACLPGTDQMLHKNETFNIGYINLSKMVTRRGRLGVDYPKLVTTIGILVRFLDNAIDQIQYPIPEMEQNAQCTRTIGIGIMGWSDMLVQLGIAYASQAAYRLGRALSHCINTAANQYSKDLIVERLSCPFRKGIRNVIIICIAPSDQIRLFSNNQSTGISPMDSNLHNTPYQAYVKTQQAWTTTNSLIANTVPIAEDKSAATVLGIIKNAMEAKSKLISITRDSTWEKIMNSVV